MLSKRCSSSLAGVKLLAVLAIAIQVSAQSTQTLPRNFDSGAGGSGSAFPFNNTANHTWQWHYDSGQFNAMGPIIITEIYIRGLNNSAVAAFNFPSVEITMASSPTNYTVAATPTQAGHSTTFAANLNPDATVVRAPTPWIGTPPPATWIPMGLTTPFPYNPLFGNDFVIQIRKCGTVTAWGQSIFGSAAGAGLNGGNRYGDQANCAATVSTFSNNEYVPIVRIDYLEENNLSISQSGPGIGDLNLSLTMIPAGAYEGWTLISSIVTQPAGSGWFLGINPDPFTFDILSYPYFPGNPFHFRPGDAGVFPSTPFLAGPGSVSALTTLTFDFVCILLKINGLYDSRSNVVRYTFL